MGRYDFKPLRVHQHAKQCLESRRLKTPPVWYDIINKVTPAQTLIRTPPIQHPMVQTRLKTLPGQGKPVLVETPVTKRRGRSKKASRLFQPVEITYEEDELRKEFFEHHPWELARPRILLENDGNDFLYHDWSQMMQQNRGLDGESVIQRQLWLLHNVPNITKSEAYDQARQEFYRLRLQEDVERRVAKEEAEATGAYWGKSPLEISEELEDKEYNRWLDFAEKEYTRLQLLHSSFGGASIADENELPELEVEIAAESVLDPMKELKGPTSDVAR